MGEMAHNLVAAVPGLAGALIAALQEPGALDRVGALAIGVAVTACLLLAPSS